MYAFGGTDEDTDTHAQAGTKRRVRKGTRSCWECKRRKMKCTLDPLTNNICNGCQRRGSKCVSQKHPKDTALSMYTSATLHGRTPTTPGEVGRKTDGILTPPSTSLEPAQSLALYQVTTVASASRGKYERLSQFLHQSLPSREDTERICNVNANRHPFVPVLAHEILTVPYANLQQNGLRTPESLLETPQPNSHPVLIARHMLQMAVFLQHVHPNIHEEAKGLSQSPRAIRERLADLAISLVTTNNELLGSIEGLECVMIESMYEANVGNLRRSWVASRRAISIAQLMDLNRLNNRVQYKIFDPETEYHPQHMWFRIIFLDRHLSLMLGLPQGPLDHSMASDVMLANDTPTGRLERLHCVLASRILERNESGRAFDDLALTRTLDVELQRAARNLPSKWWLAPNLYNDASTDSKALFWDTKRLFAQVLHYNLLNQLHLPYMLRSCAAAEHKYDYSRSICVNASREVLSRFITLRSFNRIAYSWGCRIVDFLALMAALTLLLAHLDSHRSSELQNLLAHQYHTDRAMIEQAQEHMKEVNRLNSDALSAQSVDLLSWLLAIDVETADGHSNSARRVSVHESRIETTLPDSDDDAIVRVHIPYFGIIKITHEGVSKEVPKSQATATTSRSTQSQAVDKQSPSELAGASGYSTSEAMSPADAGDGHVEALLSSSTGANNVATTFLTPQFPNDLSDSLLQHEEYPDLAAVGADWAFQGVDLAFFDSLMGTTGNEGNEDHAECWMGQR